jgi:hypothetical protein
VGLVQRQCSGRWGTGRADIRLLGAPVRFFTTDSASTRVTWVVVSQETMSTMAGPLDAYRIAMTFEVGDSAHAFGMGGMWIWYSPL